LLEPLLKEADPDLELVTKGFDVVYNRDYPSYEFLADVDAVVVSGSFVADAWVHTPWISRLAGYIVYLHDVWPQIRLCGICFGHQVIARAFGSDVGPMEAGWELGATKLQLTEAGRDVVSSPEDPKDILTIQQIHSDEVKSVPEGFELLASSKRCKVQIIAQRYPANEEPPNYKHRARLPPAPYCNIHIYAMQGHPECQHPFRYFALD
jgi:GMP synthase-like glutamine amidotransferase